MPLSHMLTRIGRARPCSGNLEMIAKNDLSNLGDTSTLADPAVVNDLVANRAGA
jgi:hypothetical protein